MSVARAIAKQMSKAFGGTPKKLKAQSEEGQIYLDRKLAETNKADLPQEATEQGYREDVFHHVGTPNLKDYDVEAERVANREAPVGMYTYGDKKRSDLYLRDHASWSDKEVEQIPVVSRAENVFVIGADKPTEEMRQSFIKAMEKASVRKESYEDMPSHRREYYNEKINKFMRYGDPTGLPISPQDMRKIFTDNGIDMLLRNGEEFVHLKPEMIRKTDADFDPVYKDSPLLKALRPETVAAISFGLFASAGSEDAMAAEPTWLLRAMDESTPTTEDNETVKTQSEYLEELGGEVLFPTIRMDEEGNLYKPDDPLQEALDRGDYILIEGPAGKETAAKATEVSKAISDMISEKRFTKQFAKGGSVEKDPISGNEVPTGALPNEVRDDVPAMLSEGEFVIPADVVRYIGLDKLRKMRDQAKKGLADMDSEGQIGGEEAVVEMAQGGYLGAKTPDYMKQSERLFTAPKMQNLPKEGQAMYGGQFPTTTPAGPVTPTPVVPTVGQAPTYEMRKYRHPDGRVLYVPVIGGVEQIAVPEGFVIADRAQDIGDEAEKIKDGEDTAGDTPDTGVAPLPTPDTGSGDSGDGMPDPGSSLVGEAARIEQMGETLNDPELTKLANELKWEQTWEGIKDAAKMLIVPGGMIAAFKEGTEDKPTVQRDENGSVNVDEKGHPIYVDKDGKVVTVETTDKQNALHEYIYNQYGEDIARTLLGASDAKVSRNEMSEMMTQMAESFGLAVKDGTLTPEQARQYQMTAMAGLLNSPAAKEGKLGEELAKSSVQKELNWFDRLFMSEADEKAAEAKRTEQLSSNAKDIKAAMDLKAAQEALAKQQEEERKAEEERIRAADEAEKQRIAAAQAKALADQQAAAAQMGSKAYTGGSQTNAISGKSYTPNYDISSWYSDSGPVSSGGGYTAGSSGTSGWSSASTSSSLTSDPSSGYAGAKGGLVTKKHVKKSKKKGLIAKK